MAGERLKMGVVGVGHFGKFHAAKVAGSPNADLVAVADSDGSSAREGTAQQGAANFADSRTLPRQTARVCLLTTSCNAEPHGDAGDDGAFMMRQH